MRFVCVCLLWLAYCKISRQFTWVNTDAQLWLVCVCLQLMDRELLPSLRKLEQQCEEYHEYAHLSQRNEMLKRQCVAYNYMETQK